MNEIMPVTNRYHTSAIVLHWFMALAVIVMLISGLYMANGDMPKSDQYKMYQLHKAGGVTMLWMICFRIAIRLIKPPPSLPADLSLTNKRVAKIGHLMLYAGLILLPISGWFMVSSSPFGLPTFVFVDWIKWPHVPWVSKNKFVETLSNTAHWILAYLMIVLITGHVAALIYHHKKHHINLLKRMWFRK